MSSRLDGSAVFTFAHASKQAPFCDPSGTYFVTPIGYYFHQTLLKYPPDTLQGGRLAFCRSLLGGGVAYTAQIQPHCTIFCPIWHPICNQHQLLFSQNAFLLLTSPCAPPNPSSDNKLAYMLELRLLRIHVQGRISGRANARKHNSAKGGSQTRSVSFVVCLAILRPFAFNCNPWCQLISW